MNDLQILIEEVARIALENPQMRNAIEIGRAHV